MSKLSCIRKLLIPCLILSFQAHASQGCEPSFPYKNAWLGADAAYSIPLTKTKSLWLFGDTFINKTNQQSRQGSKLIANSIGLSECSTGQFTVNYFWRSFANKPYPFIADPAINVKYWPQAGFKYKNQIYIFWRAIKTDNQQTEGFNFKGIGTTLTQIHYEPTKAPQNWQMKQQKLAVNASLAPGVGLVLEPPYVYIFSLTTPNHALILQRLALKNLDKYNVHIETYQNGYWRKNLKPGNASIVVPSAANEISVLYNKQQKRWYMIYSEFPNKILARSSNKLTGPWSKPTLISTLPLSGRDEFCYAAKAHAQYKSTNIGGQQITYVCNSFNLQELIQNLDLYKVLSLGNQS